MVDFFDQWLERIFCMLIVLLENGVGQKCFMISNHATDLSWVTSKITFVLVFGSFTCILNIWKERGRRTSSKTWYLVQCLYFFNWMMLRPYWLNDQAILLIAQCLPFFHPFTQSTNHKWWWCPCTNHYYGLFKNFFCSVPRYSSNWCAI